MAPKEVNFERRYAMERLLLSIAMWFLFVGGLFGGVVGMIKFFTGGTPTEYGVMGIGGGFWLLAFAVVIFIRGKI